MSKIITVTLNTALDCVISEEEFKTGKGDFSHMKIIPAGKGLNVSRALASFDEFSICLGFVGSKDKQLFESFSNSSIKTDFTYIEGNTRKNITVTKCEDGLEHHETNPGFFISEDEKNFQKNKIFSYSEPGDYIIFSGSLPQGLSDDSYYELIKEAKERKLIPILDTSKAALKSGINASPFLIKPNREELSSLTDTDLSSKEALKAFMRELSFDKNIEYILTTLSEKGAILYKKTDDSFIEAPVYNDLSLSDLPIISSVGCGDCSLAGFIYGIKHGLDAQAALKLSMQWAYKNLFTEIPGDLNI